MTDKYFMSRALEQARNALAAGEFPVGCVVVHENRIIAYASRIGTTDGQTNEIDHAEMVALRQVLAQNPKIIPKAATVYVTLEPCLMCFGALLIAGIGKIVYAYEDVMGGGTGCPLSSLPLLYKSRPPVIVPNILRNESLALFRSFFSNPSNRYLKESLLAKYSLAAS
ncbi:MAG: nucleoside deaminase [Deltaproteobacteria bacterium]|nr:nucleoside deaminase [Deltaproteobacteria bacterium]